MNFLHNDIKPENILVTKKATYLIDFGLASDCMGADGEHVPEVVLNKFKGNFMFASMNQCEGYTNSRRSDIESALYVLIYMLNDSRLPWSDFASATDISFTRRLQERTKKKYVKKLFMMCPKELRSCLSQVMQMPYQEEP